MRCWNQMKNRELSGRWLGRHFWKIRNLWVKDSIRNNLAVYLLVLIQELRNKNTWSIVLSLLGCWIQPLLKRIVELLMSTSPSKSVSISAIPLEARSASKISFSSSKIVINHSNNLLLKNVSFKHLKAKKLVSLSPQNHKGFWN